MHNILRIFNVLQNFLLTTSEAMGGYYLSSWCIRVAERLKTQDLRKLGNIRKESKLRRMKAQCHGTVTKDKVCQHQQKSPEIQHLNFSSSSVFFMKSRASLKYFVTDCLRKTFLDPNSTQTHSNLISSTILVSVRLLTLFQSKARAVKIEKRAKIFLAR